VPSTPADGWLTQSASDHWAAKRLLDPDDSQSFCHAVAKSQQSVEKTVKAIVFASRQIGITINFSYSHNLDAVIQGFNRAPRKKHKRTDVLNRICGLLGDPQIRVLSALAPERPPPGSHWKRNTEYPFQDDASKWVAPADEGAFSFEEAKRFERFSERLFLDACKIISAIRRSKAGA